MSPKLTIFVGYLAMLVLEVMKRQTKQLNWHCRYNQRIFNFLTQILNPQSLNTFYGKWQLVWDTGVNNKLHSITVILSEWRPAFTAEKNFSSLG